MIIDLASYKFTFKIKQKLTNKQIETTNKYKKFNDLTSDKVFPIHLIVYSYTYEYI